MARYFQCLPILLALVALSYGKDKADDEAKTTFEVTKEIENCKRKSKNFDKLTIHYVGSVTSTGTVFDSSVARKEPFEFQLGMGEAIAGWDEGLKGMCVGEKRTLKVPASKAYGEEGAGDGRIPPNTDLTFECELMKIEDGEAPPDVFSDIDVNNDRKLNRDEMFNYLKKRAKEYGLEGEESHQQHLEVVQQIFDNEDKDNDGLIAHKEFSGPKHEPTERDEL